MSTLNPKNPWAAYELMRITGAGQGGPGDTLRKWFDRTVAARYDFANAYSAYLHYSKPRWGGSHRHTVAFGMACAAGKQYQTKVPAKLLDALDAVARDGTVESLDGFRDFYTDPVIAPALLYICDSYQKTAQSAREKQNWQSRLAIYAWLSGDMALARRAWHQTGGNITPEAAYVLEGLHKDPVDLQLDVAAAEINRLDTLRRAQKAYTEGDLKPARTLTMEVGNLLAAKERRGAIRMVKLIDMEEKLKTGATVDLDTKDGLLLWHTPLGYWQPTPDGGLSITGFAGNGRIFHRARVGANYEITAAFTFTESKSGGPSIQLLGGMRSVGISGIMWNAGGVYSNSTKIETSLMIDRGLAKTQLPWKASPVKDLTQPFTLTMRVQDGKVTLRLNDFVGFDQIQPLYGVKTPKPLLWPKDGLVGLGSYQFLPTNTIRIQGIKVKRLL